MELEKFSKYEIARILGARALQIAMNAPLLIDIKQEDLERIKFDSLKIAEIELNSDILPISIKKPLPPRKEKKLRRIKEKEISDAKKKAIEKKEEKEISQKGEIMGITETKEEKETDEVDKKDEEEKIKEVKKDKEMNLNKNLQAQQ